PGIFISFQPTKQQDLSTPVTKITKNLRHDGDINSDGQTNLVDMSRLLAVMGQKGAQEADLNDDKSVNTMDVLQLRNILVKNGALGRF
ncbi:MAG: dockerin type I domain-containing protein, partial [Candidatus Daviesbacteria bacterium]|nr:dockerin type I domain-containing protein [Candidatus Daviesbacteria bacterium]